MVDAGGRLLLLVCVYLCGVSGDPIGSSNIDCGISTNLQVGQVDEGYTGDVEHISGIPAGSNVMLAPHIIPEHLDFLELNFTLGETTAMVRTRTALDAEALQRDGTLYYSIKCEGSDKFSHMRTLQINDLNDNSPVFAEDQYSTRLSEAAAVNSEVLTVMAEDADATIANSRITYSIVPESEEFMVNSGGVITLKTRLNYNLVQSYNIMVMAQDPKGLNDTAPVLITVEDFDNMNPYFNHNLYRALIPENQVGPFQTLEPEQIKAQDGDTGINMTLSYTISQVSPEKYRANFGIDSVSGVVSVVMAFDREEMNSSLITVSIKAAQTDDSFKTADAVVSVTVEDVNDNPPEFDQLEYSAAVLENSPDGTVVFKATVSDADEGGFVGTLRVVRDFPIPFSIDADGTVRVSNSTALDREDYEGIAFEIEAQESEPPNRAVRARIEVDLLDVNDNSPKFSSDTYKGKVFANQTEGMLLVQVEAEDPDLGLNGQVKYSIEFGNDEGYFSIDENTGAITLIKTIPLTDTITKFSLFIKARDQGDVSRSALAQVNIDAPGDSKPQFLEKVYWGTIEEEQDPGVLVVKVNFLSGASEGPVTLSVESEAEKFAISSDGKLTTRMKLDYDDGPHNYSVDISISDGASSDSAVVEVTVMDINDNSPVFSPASITASVPEDAEQGSNVTVVSATDKDSGFNQEIRYSLRGGEGRFSVHPVSGALSVAAPLDRETRVEYELQLVAEDQGRPSRSATAPLLVQVSDVNDNAPLFSSPEYQVEVSEEESVGSDLLAVTASDPDEGANGTVSYSVVQQSPPSEPAVFELDSSSGTLKLAQPLDYSEVKAYRLTVQASDGGSPPLTRNVSVLVAVMDVNNNYPKFSQNSYNMSVSENLASGASILTLEVTDRDEGGFSNGYFLYANDTFDINKQGVVSLRRDAILDRETTDRYTIEVRAVDQPVGGLTSTAQLSITVLDYNDNAPQFLTIPDPLKIPEGNYSEEDPAEVFPFVVTDADLGPNGDVTLSLPSPHLLFRFREDGTLLAVGRLDRESQETYELIVKAADGGVPQRENVTAVRVRLLDVNDNTPEFSSSSYVSSILLKDAEEGKLLLTLAATDRDAGDNGVITYSFSSGSSPYLALDSKTGEITLTSDLADITEDTTVKLMAKAEDHGEPPLSSTASVVVNLRVASLVEGVAFWSSSYNFSLPENEPAESTVGTVLAYSGSDLYDVSYAVKTHTDLFSISAGGAITTKAALDREKLEWYILDVEAVDTRTPPTTAITLVRVQVEDVNEAPTFDPEGCKASVFSIAPYKTPVVTVKASDPDIGEDALLVYSLSEDSPHFDVDPSSGVVFVVSVASLAGQSVHLQVKASDPRGLEARTQVEVEVQGRASSSDVVVISVNQPANAVERKIPELEESLSDVLDWTVTIIEVTSADGGPSESRTVRVEMRTLISFISEDEDGVVSSEEVTEKLHSQSDSVREELGNVFGEDLHFDVEAGSQGSTSNLLAIILGVFLGLSVLGLVVFISLFVRLKRQNRAKSPDKVRLEIDSSPGFTSWNDPTPDTPEQGNRRREDEEERRDRRPDDEERL